MNLIYVLLFTVFLLLFISYKTFGKDILSPSVVLCGVYIFSILCAIYNIDNWGIDIHYNTYFVITFGIIIFIIGEIVVNLVFSRVRLKQNKAVTRDITEIKVSNKKIILIAVFSVGVFALYFREVYRIALLGGAGGLDNMMSHYRMTSSYSVIAVEDRMNIIVSQLYKALLVSANVFLYVFINNVIYNKKIIRNLKYLVPVILYIATSLLTGGRMPIIILSVMSIVLGYILWHQKAGWSKSNTKFILIGVISILVLVIGFSSLRGVIGRASQDNTLDYVTNYVGGSIQLFDVYMQDPQPKNDYFGGETFYSMHNFLRKYLHYDYNMIIHLEFRQLGNSAGNVYTGFRRNIQDFGMLGMIIFQFLMSLFYSFIYYSIKQGNQSKFYVFVHAYIFFAIALHPQNDYFYCSLLSVNYLIQIILLRIAYWFFVDLKIKLKEAI